MGTKRMRPRVQPFMTFHPRRTNSMRMRVRERVIRRTSCMKTPREKLMRGEEVTSRKTHTRTPTNSQLQGEGTLRTTPMRIPTRLPREEVEGEEASLPSPSTTTRPRLTTRSALTPMTSYPISRWLTKAGGSGKPMDASASSQQTMLRCGNDVSEGDAEAEVEEERRSGAEPTNIKTPCPPI